jgi:hypothetical protein
MEKTMKRRAAVLLLATAAACGALAGGPAMAAGAPSPAGHWGNAQKLAGLGKLNDHDAQVTAVSCATPGNCAAGGNYEDTAKQTHAFVASETSGRWGKAIQVAVPGSVVTSQIDSVSCGSPANCEAAGSFTDSGSHRHVFVVAELNGSWGMASEVPGVATLTGSEMFSYFGLVSCPSAGNCAIGGSYLTAPGFGYVFVADERNGVWGTAQQAPGITDLHKTAFASINSVSCASPGNCAAAGRYVDASLKGQAFVVDEKAGTWGRAQPVPEMSMLKAVSSTAESVSCASAGNCTVAGHYTDDHNKTQAFIADETGGTWGSPQQVPGTGALNVAGIADVTSVSCGAPGNCATIGFYTDSKGNRHVFAADEKNGTWQAARTLVGAGGLSFFETGAVSCATAGNCVATGIATTESGLRVIEHAVVVQEVNGGWGRARELPGSAALNRGGDAAVLTASCASPGNCAVGGWYTDKAGKEQAMVSDESSMTAISLSLSAAKARFGHEQTEKISVKVTARTGGTPGGKVTVTANQRTACVITLAGGKGSCTLSARKLSPGSYQLTGHYAGDGTFGGSASAAKTLTVTR